MLNRLCIPQAPHSTYPIFNHPSLISGFNEWIWVVSGLGLSNPDYYKAEVSQHLLALYVAGV